VKVYSGIDPHSSNSRAEIRLVEEWSDEPILDTLSLLYCALFNFLIGNADSHAKNLSFLYAGGTVRLAPFYDLLSTAVYERVSNKFAMRMGGQKDPRYLMATNLARFAGEAGIELRTVRAQLLELCGKMEGTIEPLAETFREADRRPFIIEDIIRVVEQRLRKARSLIV